MRARVKPTFRTWILVLLALVASGVIAWLETRDREGPQRRGEDREYTVDVELE